MRLSDLRGKPIKSADGEALGRVHEVVCDKGRIVAVMCGSASLIERWTGRSHGRRVPWTSIDRVGRDAIVLKPAGREGR